MHYIEQSIYAYTNYIYIYIQLCIHIYIYIYIFVLYTYVYTHIQNYSRGDRRAPRRVAVAARLAVHRWTPPLAGAERLGYVYTYTHMYVYILIDT